MIICIIKFVLYLTIRCVYTIANIKSEIKNVHSIYVVAVRFKIPCVFSQLNKKKHEWYH